MKPNYIFILSMIGLIFLCMFFNIYVFREGATTKIKEDNKSKSKNSKMKTKTKSSTKEKE